MISLWLSGKESACSAGDPGLIPGSGRTPGKGIGYPLQYSCPEKPMDRGAWWSTGHRVAKSGTWLTLSLSILRYMLISKIYNQFIGYEVLICISHILIYFELYHFTWFSFIYMFDNVCNNSNAVI